MLNTGREYVKAGIVIDEVTMEKLVIVTGGKGGFSGGPLDTTEILMDNQWTQGNLFMWFCLVFTQTLMC